MKSITNIDREGMRCSVIWSKYLTNSGSRLKFKRTPVIEIHPLQTINGENSTAIPPIMDRLLQSGSHSLTHRLTLPWLEPHNHWKCFHFFDSLPVLLIPPVTLSVCQCSTVSALTLIHHLLNYLSEANTLGGILCRSVLVKILYFVIRWTNLWHMALMDE